MRNPDKVPHPAVFSDPLLPLMYRYIQHLGPEAEILDPMGGTGKLGKVLDFGYQGFVVINELEYEWAIQAEEYGCHEIRVGDAARLPGYWGQRFQAVLTSPVYGNRMCLAGDTLVLTDRGYLPIRQVVNGDRVLTHLGRWKRVIWAGVTGVKPTVSVHGQGGWRISCTRDHKFLARRRTTPQWKNLDLGEPEWVEAHNLEKMYWQGLTAMEALPFPEAPIQTEGNFWWFVGFWLANGHVSKADRSLQVCNDPKYLELTDGYLRGIFGSKIKGPAYHGSSVPRWSLHSQALVRWMLEHFGKLASGKRLPGWAITLPTEDAEALLSGYLFGDGCVQESSERGSYNVAASINAPMLRGFQAIAERLGYGTCFSQVKKKGRELVAGRLCEVQDAYQLRVLSNPSRKEHRVGSNVAWQVRKVVAETPQLVYDLVIEDDHSFLANGIIVHNSDHHEAKDDSKRITYRHKLGRMPTEGSSAVLQWGDKYRELHLRILQEILRVLAPGGIFVLNISDHVRRGVLQQVTRWYIQVAQSIGLTLLDWEKVETSRMRYGANGKARASYESLLVFSRMKEAPGISEQLGAAWDLSRRAEEGNDVGV